MATEAVPPAATASATINLSPGFHFDAQDSRLEQEQDQDQAPLFVAPPSAPLAGQPATTQPLPVPLPPKPKDPPLGILSKFTGTFAGTGFNLIFRPNNGPNGTKFPVPVKPPPPTAPSENTLELNLTTETLAFSNPLGNVPNRGLGTQADIFLNGVPYVQTINDVTNPKTGKADNRPSGIHFEPGLWMHVPATTTNPVVGESLVRMASIPHGTTINAQSLVPNVTIAGPPTIPKVDITPFVIGSTNKIPFVAQKASALDTPRLPQNLTKFIAAGTITQAILDDPNIVLRNENAGKKITKTTVFTVSTAATVPKLDDGTSNIDFLQGAPQGAPPGNNPVPNAVAAKMSATFWIEEVQHQIQVPVHKVGAPPLKIPAPKPHPGALAPVFLVNPPREITKPRTITVTSTQIQYSQNVDLNFAGLTWPHVSVATLVPQDPVPGPASAFN